MGRQVVNQKGKNKYKKNHHIYLYLLECKREAKELIDGEKQEMKKR